MGEGGFHSRVGSAVLVTLWGGLMGACSAVQTDFVDGNGYRHAVATFNANSDNNETLHIYIGGDGKPFVTPTEVAADPTPRSTYVLKLQRRDPQSSVFLGRPCYHGLSRDVGCSPLAWTTERYSEAVVLSMATAIRNIGRGQRVMLIGYSGGGTLAMLIAPRLDNVEGVVTVAANLDIDAWASYHGYTRLAGSLNPVVQSVETQDLPQRHYFGSADVIIPAVMVERVRQAMPQGTVAVMEGFDHTCCWRRAWPRLLEQALSEFRASTRNAQSAIRR